jgi:hypothetical protein
VPSKISPTTSPRWFTSGLPEFAAADDIVGARQVYRRAQVERWFRASHDGGSTYGAAPVAPSNRLPIVVYGATAVPDPFAKPFTAP